MARVTPDAHEAYEAEALMWLEEPDREDGDVGYDDDDLEPGGRPSD